MTMPAPMVYNPPVPNPPFVDPTIGAENARDWSDTPNAAWAPGPIEPVQMPRRAYRPDPTQHSREFYLGVHGPGRDEIQRHGVEFLDADGRTADVPIVRRYADKPYQTTEPRPTNRMSPSTYVFTRPFDQRFARQLNGQHFSMADHRREYPIMGQEPTRRRRTTWRAEPTPWDANLTDMPSPVVRTPMPGQVTAVEVPASRNSRLT